MLHTKCYCNRPTGSGEENFKGFLPYMGAVAISWSCDPEPPNKLSLSHTMKASHKTRRLFCFGSLVVLDVVFRYLSLCLLYINTKISKNRCLMLE